MSTLITDTSILSQMPYKPLLTIQTLFPDGHFMLGTAVVVGTNDVLTSASMVYQTGHGGAAVSYTLYPAEQIIGNLTRAFPYDWRAVAHVSMPASAWDADGNGDASEVEAASDIALLALPGRIADKIGMLPLASQPLTGQATHLYFGTVDPGWGMHEREAAAQPSTTYPGTYEFFSSSELNQDQSRLLDWSPGSPLLNANNEVLGVYSTTGYTAAGSLKYFSSVLGARQQWLRDEIVSNDRYMTATPATGTAGADRIVGEETPDSLSGLAGDDHFLGMQGNDDIDGGEGIDTAEYAGSWGDFRFMTLIISGERVLSGGWRFNEGDDRLYNVERLQFSDAKVAIDLDGNAGDVAKVLGAVLGAPSVKARPDLVGLGLGLADAGASIDALMGYALEAVLGRAASNEAVVNLLYTNIVGSAPDAPTLQYFTQAIESGAYTQTSLAVMAAQTDLNSARIDLVGLAATGIAYS